MENAATTAGGVDLVLLGRTDLMLADTSSPILLPDWFPVAAGYDSNGSHRGPHLVRPPVSLRIRRWRSTT